MPYMFLFILLDDVTVVFVLNRRKFIDKQERMSEWESARESANEHEQDWDGKSEGGSERMP